jgi:acylphosphatase
VIIFIINPKQAKTQKGTQMGDIGCKVIVSGHVQGVGFRFYTSREAHKQGLTGHAKNLYSGDVEVVLYGSDENISNMLKWLEKGPATADVNAIKVSNIPYIKTPDFPCF